MKYKTKVLSIFALLCLPLWGLGAWAGKVMTDDNYDIGVEEHVFTTAALIVIVICVTVVILAFIAKQTLLAWREGMIAYQANESNQKKSDELLDKYLDLLDKRNEQGAYDGDEYRETLARLVDLSQKGKLSDVTEDALNDIFKNVVGAKPAETKK